MFGDFSNQFLPSEDVLVKLYPEFPWKKAAFNKKQYLFTSTMDLNLRNKLVKCYIWSMALYGAETMALRAADQKHQESFEMWC
jgi:hypothetical protein